MNRAAGHDVVVVGAGILGLAGAYHILREDKGVDLLVLDRFPGAGRGSTAKSAAAYRDMFSSPVNRYLSRGSVSFYEKLQEDGVRLDLRRIGYLWLLRAEQLSRYDATLEIMARSGAHFETLTREELSRRLPELTPGDIAGGVLGLRCGILNPSRLVGFYEQRVARLGGRLQYGIEVSGFTKDSQGRINGVKVGEKEIPAAAVIIATGAWMGATMALAGLTVPVVPVKRQLFTLAAKEGPLRHLLYTRGFNAPDLLPFTILPDGVYLRPAPTASSFIVGYANEDQAPGLEDWPRAEREFFEQRIRPQLEQYLPQFRGLEPEYAWAGHYENHPPDNIPFVDRVGGALVVGGASGSGIMKADSLGRVAAGLYFGKELVELGDGRYFRVAEIGLKERALAPEEFVI